MSNDFTATWLERKIPYSSMYTSDFDQKYPKASNLPSGTEKLQKRNWETAFYGMYIRGCQIGMQGPQLCTGPRHFCKLDVPSSRLAFLDLKLHVLQLGTSNSNN